MAILGSWSGMRKYLEKEMLCKALKGRVRYHLTTHPNMDGFGYFQIFVDDQPKMTFSMAHAASQLYKEAGAGTDFWSNFRAQKDRAQEHQHFDDEDFAQAMRQYRAIPIAEALNSVNSIVRMFAVLDRRVGKRMLHNLKNQITEQPAWLQFFYQLRLESENII